MAEGQWISEVPPENTWIIFNPMRLISYTEWGFNDETISYIEGQFFFFSNIKAMGEQLSRQWHDSVWAPQTSKLNLPNYLVF